MYIYVCTYAHQMDDFEPGKDGKDLHYIEFIWIIDQDTGECLGAKNLYPGQGVEATASFKGKFADKCITPYALCNLHGTWRGQHIGTPKEPEPTIQEIVEETPMVDVDVVAPEAAGGEQGGVGDAEAAAAATEEGSAAAMEGGAQAAAAEEGGAAAVEGGAEAAPAEEDGAQGEAMDEEATA